MMNVNEILGGMRWFTFAQFATDVCVILVNTGFLGVSDIVCQCVDGWVGGVGV